MDDAASAAVVKVATARDECLEGWRVGCGEGASGGVFRTSKDM